MGDSRAPSSSGDMSGILFIDFDGTICSDRFWKSLPKEEYERIQDDFFKGDGVRVHDWMCGKLTSEEITEHLSKVLGIDYEKLWNTFVADCKSFALEAGVFEAIGEARAKYTTVLMTDNMDSLNRFTAPALRLDEVFDVIWNSYDHGILKNDDNGRAYLDACDEFGADIKNCTLIDDREKSTDTFAALGGQIYLTKGPSATLMYLREFSNAPGAL